MVTLRADPWSPDYGGDVEAALAAREGTEIQVDPTIETADWSRAIVPLPGPAGPLLFVDGVRRVEMRVLAEDGGRRAWGLAGSYAVGAVRSDGRATFEAAVVGRILALGGAIESPDLVVRIGTGGAITYRAIAVPGDDPEAPLQVLQNEMREAEGRLAAELAPGGLVLADGPLHYPHEPGAAVVGIAKRMVMTYLEGEPAALLPRLVPGERTPLFALGRQILDRFAWYQRLIELREPWHDLSGLVRCEVRMALGIARARELADRVAVELPRFAGRPGIDPRAPQNLTPVGALETELRRRMGNPELLRRALQSELHRAAVA
ncbi:MAG: hypothetical protein ACXWWR_02930 [Candidatus Limnocylindrales bacterium]